MARELVQPRAKHAAEFRRVLEIEWQQVYMGAQCSLEHSTPSPSTIGTVGVFWWQPSSMQVEYGIAMPLERR